MLSADGPLIVAGLFRTSSGIGESARTCADAFEKHGLNVVRCDLSDAFSQVDLPTDNIFSEFPSSRHGTLILHLNAPETLTALRSLGYRKNKRWRIIGYWVWELESLPKSWVTEAQHLNEIWTPTEFSARAISNAVDIPVKVVPHFVKPPEGRIHTPAFRHQLPPNSTVVGIFADGRSSFDRKNLLGSLRAFLSGVGANSDCWLLIKTRNLTEHPAIAHAVAEAIHSMPRIIQIDSSLPKPQQWGLIDSCDIMLSLHRSEGFGLVLAEAMSLGKCVVATGWSGNTDFMNKYNAFPVSYRLVEAIDSTGVYGNLDENLCWADPDLSRAAKLLSKLVRAPELRAKIGANAAATVKEQLDGAAYVSALSSVQTP